jgi:spore maturation protein CgeB
MSYTSENLLRERVKQKLRHLRSLFTTPHEEECIQDLVPCYNTGRSDKPSVLYIGLKRNYGRPGDGYSYEEINFFYSLFHGGYPVYRFSTDTLYETLGYEKMQRLLLGACTFYRPKVLFHLLHHDEIGGDTLKRISQDLGIPTIGWFSDDHWRFDSFSRLRAPLYDWVCTTDAKAPQKYAELGLTQVLRSQWGVNHFLYHPVKGAYRYDVSFVGQPHGRRKRIIEELEREGIRVYLRGRGWGEGWVDFPEMLSIFSASKINLNLSNASVERDLLQIKGRDFEVPGCGGFLLTQHNPALEEYFTPGEEIATYQDIPDMARKIRYYLEHEEEREALRKRGYRRALEEHTFQRRLERIFSAVLKKNPEETPAFGEGLPCSPSR